MGIEQLATRKQIAMDVLPSAISLPRTPEQAQNQTEPIPVPAALVVPGIAAAKTSTMEFSLNVDSGRVVVKIIDSATREVVRQIPMEEMLALAKALDRFQGLLLQTKA